MRSHGGPWERGFLWLALAATAAAAQAGERIAIDVEETAGIRRFQYPVAVELRLPQAVAKDARFRLLRAGKPVLAQVRATEAGDKVARWWLDFPVDLLPYERAVYEVQYGRDVPEGPGSKRGQRLIQSDTEFQVANDPYIVWSVPRDLDGLLRSVRAGKLEYLRTGSEGLLLRDTSGKDHKIGAGKEGRPKASVTREGPLAVGLKFEFAEPDPALAEVRSTVDLTFPVFKSWVEVDWRIDDPRGRVAGVAAKLHVNLDAPARQSPTLLDFGAGSLVYVSLGPGQQAALHGASGAWQVLRGVPGRLEPFVLAPKQPGHPSRAEGWTHAMDRQRCLAMAVERFAEGCEDRLAISADGRVELDRRFAAGESGRPAAKRLRFWLHFVPFPPQQTAATSPQAMQSPVVTRTRIP